MEGLLRSPRGTRDYFGSDQELRKYIRKIIEGVFEKYGYQEAETPILNHYDTLAQKYAGGAEILKEVYRLKDQGGRDLALRYDLTVPFARLVGLNSQIGNSFRRYEIGKVFRDGPIKAGRLREFVQCDVDMVGVKSLIAEAELIVMAADIFDNLGLQVVIQYNNRKLLESVLKRAGVDDNQLSDVILSLDKLEKIGEEAVTAEIIKKGIEKQIIEETFTQLTDIFENGLTAEITEGTEEIRELQNYIYALGIEDKTRFTPFLARGLEIYTGTIFEVFLENSEITSSVASGGRYDRIIGSFLGDKCNEREYPAVGISFGLDVMFQALVEKGVSNTSKVDVYIIPLGTQIVALQIAQELRKQGYKVLIDMEDRRLKKSLDYANKNGIDRVIILGSEEVEKQSIRIRYMDNGTEQLILQQEFISNTDKYLKGQAAR